MLKDVGMTVPKKRETSAVYICSNTGDEGSIFICSKTEDEGKYICSKTEDEGKYICSKTGATTITCVTPPYISFIMGL